MIIKYSAQNTSIHLNGFETDLHRWWYET